MNDLLIVWIVVFFIITAVVVPVLIIKGKNFGTTARW